MLKWPDTNGPLHDQPFVLSGHLRVTELPCSIKTRYFAPLICYRKDSCFCLDKALWCWVSIKNSKQTYQFF